MKRIQERDTSSELAAVLGVGDRVSSKSLPLKGTVYTIPGGKVAVSWDDKSKSSPANIKDLKLIDEMISRVARGESAAKVIESLASRR